ncbi:hypothetical protein YC2023_047624 [Brassica napus]
MGNCCGTGGTLIGNDKNKKGFKIANPFSIDYGRRHDGDKLVVLKEPTGRDIKLRYNLGRELGRGEFGVTYLCTDNETGESFACKSILKKKLRTAVDIDDVRREAEIMRVMPEHPNIVTLKETYEDDKAVHLVMELCGGGELFDRIVARGHYTERAAASVIKTIMEVVQMCHKHGVMHRDLKPENFLFANKKETAPLKAIDFGLSIFFKPGEKFNEIVGSPYYMAPEVLKQSYGPEIDIWSAGVILYILLCGVPPFWAETDHGVAKAILKSVIDFRRDPLPKVSSNAKDLIKRMLHPDPKRRLTAQQVIAEHLSVEEASGIIERFQVMDTSNRGKITIQELRLGLRKLGIVVPQDDIQILMDAGDVDKDGYIDINEFVAISVHIRKMGNDEHLKKAFKFFDLDKSGYIEIDELRDALADEFDTTSEEVVEAIIYDVDTNKDGRISYEEFATMMKTGTDWRKASRQYSRDRFKNLSRKLMQDGSLQSHGDTK